MTLAMTTTAMADLSERARRVLDLQAKASPGPWSAHDGIRQFTMPGKSDPQTVCNCGVIDAEDHAVAYALGAEDEDHTLGEGIGQSGKHYNAAFIAAAHESADLIRELLEENERLRDGIKQIRAAVKSEQMHYLKRYQNEKSAYREGGSDVADAIMSAVDVTIAHITAKAEQIASLVGDMEPVEHNTRAAGPTPLRGRVTRRQD